MNIPIGIHTRHGHQIVIEHGHQTMIGVVNVKLKSIIRKLRNSLF